MRWISDAAYLPGWDSFIIHFLSVGSELFLSLFLPLSLSVCSTFSWPSHQNTHWVCHPALTNNMSVVISEILRGIKCPKNKQARRFSLVSSGWFSLSLFFKHSCLCLCSHPAPRRPHPHMQFLSWNEGVEPGQAAWGAAVVCRLREQRWVVRQRERERRVMETGSRNKLGLSSSSLGCHCHTLFYSRHGDTAYFFFQTNFHLIDMWLFVHFLWKPVHQEFVWELKKVGNSFYLKTSVAELGFKHLLKCRAAGVTRLLQMISTLLWIRRSVSRVETNRLITWLNNFLFYPGCTHME